MNSTANSSPLSALHLLGLFLLGTGLFTFAYGQAPLYYSNQNQYFLHGLAQAGEGSLRDDWLATTRDPTPLFSALVAFGERYLHPWVFYLLFADGETEGILWAAHNNKVEKPGNSAASRSRLVV